MQIRDLAELTWVCGRPPCFLPVSGRQNLARRPDFEADDMAVGIGIVDERPVLSAPRDLAGPDGDMHRVGVGIVSHLGHRIAPFLIVVAAGATVMPRGLENILM